MTISLVGHGQDFDKKINNATLELPEEKLSGFVTTFEFPAEDVNLGWWKYAKKFALPLNQRTHYEVTIPATENSRAVVIYTQVEEKEGTPVWFKLGLKLEDVPKEEKAKYRAQAQSMLLDFKRSYYLRYFEEQLESLEKTISKSDSYDFNEWMEFVKKRNEILDKIRRI